MVELFQLTFMLAVYLNGCFQLALCNPLVLLELLCMPEMWVCRSCYLHPGGTLSLFNVGCIFVLLFLLDCRLLEGRIYLSK